MIGSVISSSTSSRSSSSWAIIIMQASMVDMAISNVSSAHGWKLSPMYTACEPRHSMRGSNDRSKGSAVARSFHIRSILGTYMAGRPSRPTACPTHSAMTPMASSSTSRLLVPYVSRAWTMTLYSPPRYGTSNSLAASAKTPKDEVTATWTLRLASPILPANASTTRATRAGSPPGAPTCPTAHDEYRPRVHAAMHLTCGRLSGAVSCPSRNGWSLGMCSARCGPHPSDTAPRASIAASLLHWSGLSRHCPRGGRRWGRTCSPPPYIPASVSKLAALHFRRVHWLSSSNSSSSSLSSSLSSSPPFILLLWNTGLRSCALSAPSRSSCRLLSSSSSILSGG
mmetsp:Transcript_24631/g.56220  ORF Transcript_24631/g.56220 Transcript_24631/m.56220 type:complete len:340 (-) Transcript_24631:1407-2426(-)